MNSSLWHVAGVFCFCISFIYKDLFFLGVEDKSNGHNKLAFEIAEVGLTVPLTGF